MGCCGHGFGDKLAVAEGIQKNTLEYHYHMNRGNEKADWMNRDKGVRKSGVCRNLIYDIEKDKVFCPCHPDVNYGVDLRIDHHFCDILHVCKTAFFYDLWDAERKAAFMKFLKDKRKKDGLDWYSYSMGMADDSFLKEFEGLDW